MHTASTQDIVRQLFDKYYASSDDRHDPLTSSHWRQYHQEANIRFEGQSLVFLSGVGFGDLQNHSFVYRLFSWITVVCYLIVLKNRFKILSILPTAISLAKKMGLFFTYDAFRQVCLLAALQPCLSKKDLRVVNIGDGYGYFSALLKTYYPNSKIVLIDLGKTLLFQANYCQRVFPDESHLLISDRVVPDGHENFVYCPAEHLEILLGMEFDLAVNVASMQEMNAKTVDRYFTFLRKVLRSDGLFYCCNREEKIMPGGEVSRISEYPWHQDDQHLWNEVCPWYRFFLTWHQALRGPRLGKFRIPFFNYFDGTLRHRLSRLVRI